MMETLEQQRVGVDKSENLRIRGELIVSDFFFMHLFNKYLNT